MANVQVDLKVAGKKFEGMGKEIREAAHRGLLAAAVRTVTIIITQIIPQKVPPPVDRGVFRAGWRYGKIPEGAEIWNSERHAVFIEDGVRGENVKPGAAMIGALIEWVMRKGIASDPIKAKGAAFAIANKMRATGIFGAKGLGILREATEKHIPKIAREEVEREIKKAVG